MHVYIYILCPKPKMHLHDQRKSKKYALGQGSTEVVISSYFPADWHLRLGALLTVASIRMISMASVETGLWSFEDVSEELFHPDTWTCMFGCLFW